MRIGILGCACALAFFAPGPGFGAALQTTAGMGGAPSGGVAEMKPNSVPLSAPGPDPAERPAKSIKCAQEADARGLAGRIRKLFLHECKRSR